MADDFLAVFMSSQARARVLRMFVLNQGEAFTLTHVAKRAGVSTGVARTEIRFLERAGIIKNGKVVLMLKGADRQVTADKQEEETWAFDPQCAYATALSRFVHETSPKEYSKLVERLKRSGKLAVIVLSGAFMGDVSRPADLLLVADGINEGRLERAVRDLEPHYGREIRYAVFTTPEFRYRLTIQDRLLRDTFDYPHLVLLDRARLL